MGKSGSLMRPLGLLYVVVKILSTKKLHLHMDMKIGISLCFIGALWAGEIVNRPVANIYISPAENVELVSQAIYGTAVEIVEEKIDWVRVRTPDAYTGWMRRAALAQARERPSNAKAVMVESLFANLYAEPSISRRAPVMTVPYETRLDVASEPGGESRRWIRVSLVDGSSAWIERANVTERTEILNVEEVVAHAKRFVGLPYLWGGVSTFGYDCSGFLQMLGRRRGAHLPRDARQQVHWDGFQNVEKRDWRPGDLLYFGKSLERITHTGMYLGGGMMIHSASPYIRIQAVVEVTRPRGLVFGRRLK
jgi:cell wall-associated NlpC family hydrolase